MQKNKKNIISLLTIAVTTILIIFSLYIWNIPSAYIGLDGKSSIGLTLNVFKRVIKTEAFGNGSDLLINEGLEKKIKNKSINEGILLSLDLMEQVGSFEQKIKDVLIISVWTKDMKEAEAFKVQLQSIASIYVEQFGYSVDIQGLVISDEAYEIAFNSGTSPARYQILERIKIALNNQLTMEKIEILTPQIEVLNSPRNYVVANIPIVEYVTITSPKNDDADDEHDKDKDDEIDED